MKITKKYLFPFLGLMLLSNFTNAQIQKGNDIDGEDTGDNSGHAVCMPDVNTVAIGAPKNDANGGNSGQVRVYNWSGSSWVQKGADLDGDAAGDLFGGTLCMPNANTIAIGAPQNDDGDVDAGQVKIFEWNGSTWNQKGSAIQGDSTAGFFGGLFGSSVSMPNANSIAVGAPWYDTTGNLSGQVKIFDWDGSNWTQRGLSINGTAYSYTGSIVRMPSSNVVGIVTQGATVGNVGMVRVFEWNGSQWLLKGSPIEGETPGDLSGNSMDMPDENTIAIGAVENDGSFPQAGHVRIFIWDGNSWIQKGNDIDGKATGDKSGNSVSMPDANTIAIGASLNSDNGSNSGHVRIFNWNGTDWVQIGTDINGESTMDESGYSVAMPQANTVAIGAIKNDAVNGSQFANEAGHVRIFELSSTSEIANNSFKNSIKHYPNPTKGNFIIEFDENINNTTLTLRNLLGQKLWEKSNISNNQVELNINAKPGIYFLEISEQNKKAIIKIIKE